MNIIAKICLAILVVVCLFLSYQNYSLRDENAKLISNYQKLLSEETNKQVPVKSDYTAVKEVRDKGDSKVEHKEEDTDKKVISNIKEMELAFKEQMDDSEEATTSEHKDEVKLHNKKFNKEPTNYQWAIDYEGKINTLFNNSERLKNINLISSECRTDTCKVVIARSNKGSFIDATTFNSVISEEQWHQLNDFSFQFGKEGQEDYVTLWLSRK